MNCIFPVRASSTVPLPPLKDQLSCLLKSPSHMCSVHDFHCEVISDAQNARCMSCLDAYGALNQGDSQWNPRSVWVVKVPKQKNQNHVRDIKESDRPLITTLAANGNFDGVRDLIKQKADINAVNGETGKTALMYAVSQGNQKGVEFLIKAKADVNRWARDEKTVLMDAVYRKHEMIAQMLINAGADVNHTAYSEGYGNPRMNYQNLRPYNDYGKTALIYGILLGSREMVFSLLAAKADPNRASIQEHTPLMYAVNRGDEAIVKAMIHAKADPNRRNKHGVTALMCAAVGGHVAIFQSLIQAKANIRERCSNDRSVFEYAAFWKQGVVLSMLVQLLESREERNNQLANAAMAGCDDLVVQLLHSQADVNRKNHLGWTPGSEAALHCSHKTLQLLLDAKANIEFPHKPRQCTLFSVKNSLRNFDTILNMNACFHVKYDFSLIFSEIHKCNSVINRINLLCLARNKPNLLDAEKHIPFLRFSRNRALRDIADHDQQRKDFSIDLKLFDELALTGLLFDLWDNGNYCFLGEKENGMWLLKLLQDVAFLHSTS